MNPTHLQHKTAVREAPSVASRHPHVPYFPEGGVAAPPFLLVNPISHGLGSFPGNGSPNDLLGPPTAEWQLLPQSHEQGAGVPPFKKWPRQFHSETYDHSSMAIMPLPDQVGPIPAAPGEQMLVNNYGQRPETIGWSMPRYGEQYEQPIAAASLGTGVANLGTPATVAYAIGWGYIG